MGLFQGAFPDEGETDTRQLSHFYAMRVFDGELPYKDIEIEYPPVSLVIMLIPRLFSDNYVGYHIAFAIQILLLDLIGLFLIRSMAARLGNSANFSSIAYTFVVLATGPIIIDHCDFAAAILALSALYVFLRGWNVFAMVLLAFAAMAKIFPIILLPIFAICLFRKQDYENLAKGAAAFLITTIAICMPFIAMSFEGFLDSFAYHSERGLQIESSYASLLLIGDSWGLASHGTSFDHAAWHLDSSIADVLAKASPVVTLAALFWLYWSFFRNQTGKGFSEGRALNYAVIAIIIFLLGNKIFSPQYIIWLCPLVPLITGSHRLVTLIIFAAVGLATQYIFTCNIDYIFGCRYSELVQAEAPGIYVLLARNLFLLAMIVLILKWTYPDSDSLGMNYPAVSCGRR